ncbi:hypothetical protein AAE02nite_10750 [Adhaeribacter aerolatus]|uniref:ABC transporter ATPase n=1 Tax=Adhaeribacter aerolatus TaxID=670289 RepID=A0A512AUM5_9BACT|nr:hypothetical protein [Adhaeribacter aerolatus]GEO03411.1 hypothetical protein AAE02nite_10750 [Adhaeribacter aerolatus]
MYIPFNQLPENARVWIYQASRTLTNAEVEAVHPLLSRFSTEWTSHGEMLQASAQIFHNRFLVLANNEDVNSPSGCSIDASVRFVKQLEEQLNVSFFDRTQLAFLKDNGVEVVPLKAIKEKISTGELAAESLYFDNTVSTAGHIFNNWPKPAKETWLARYF